MNATKQNPQDVEEQAACQEDELFVERLCSGDGSAFRTLVDRYSGQLITYVFGILHHLQDVEDVVQETFIRANRSVHQLRDKDKLWYWLKQIARNVAMDSLKRSRREGIPTAPEKLQELGHKHQLKSDSEESEADNIGAVSGLTLEAIVEAVEALPETYRQTAIYYYIQEWPYDKISGTLGIDPAAARQRISRAGRMLRSVLSGPTRKGNRKK
jgi:RNA polymerase sigma-70 factor, ECF subfamily